MSLTRRAIVLACLAAIVTPAVTHRLLYEHALASRSPSAQADTRLSGDYDLYVMVGAAPNGGFEARRRMGFAGFIYVKQDQRGRGGSGGTLDVNAMQEQDGYDAVEWAAKLPGSNGKVGVIGGSNPGLNAWYAAIAAPPHLATIAPTVATADPLRIMPYIDMVFSPTVVPWICFTAVKDRLSDVSNVNDTEAFAHLPVITASSAAGCGRPQYWNDWFDHQKDDAYWHALSIERHRSGQSAGARHRRLAR